MDLRYPLLALKRLWNGLGSSTGERAVNASLLLPVVALVAVAAAGTVYLWAPPVAAVSLATAATNAYRKRWGMVPLGWGG